MSCRLQTTSPRALSCGKGTNQGVRDHAIVAVLLGTGLRVFELTSLALDQYDGRAFKKVLTKGNYVRKRVPINPEARKVLEDWLEVRGREKGPLFLTRTESPLTRHHVDKIIQRIVGQANANKKGPKIGASAHVLRHTFLRNVAEQKGLQAALDASGRRSPRYVHRYIRLSDEKLEDAIETLE